MDSTFAYRAFGFNKSSIFQTNQVIKMINLKVNENKLQKSLSSFLYYTLRKMVL
jgi:hypothetical protein